MRKIRKGDDVLVTAGKDKGKRGTVLRVVDAERLVVEGANRVKKHQRPNPMRGLTGGIIEKEMPLHVSKVAIFNPQTRKADRVGFRVHDGRGQLSVFQRHGNAQAVEIALAPHALLARPAQNRGATGRGQIAASDLHVGGARGVDDRVSERGLALEKRTGHRGVGRVDRETCSAVAISGQSRGRPGLDDNLLCRNVMESGSSFSPRSVSDSCSDVATAGHCTMVFVSRINAVAFGKNVMWSVA